MRKNRILHAGICLVMAAALASCGKSYQSSDALTEFIAENERKVQTLYFYPSTVRMLGKVMTNEESAAFSEIENGRFVFTWDHERIDISSHFDGILAEATDEGFEMLAVMNTNGSAIHIYSNDDQTPTFLVLLENSLGDFIVEIVGELSMKSITTISQMDFKEVAGTFGLSEIDGEEEETEESPEELEDENEENS